MASFYHPSEETLSVLNNRRWICSYSGGKDSTALVTWIEWLRRSGQVAVAEPRLVLSDTGVEYPFLAETSNSLMRLLEAWGWNCSVVRPPVERKLYPSIFGRGVPPVHPGFRKKMRWCTNATKVRPMQDFGRTLGTDIVMLTGVRWGESRTRDEKLAVSCAAGGECGLPAPGEGRYAPVITWSTCQVIDWLQGMVVSDVAKLIRDLHKVTQELVKVYGVRVSVGHFGLTPPKVSALRFGCIGCPAVSRDKVLEDKVRHNPTWKALRGIYRIWDQLYKPANRVRGIRKGRPVFGPVRMEARQRLFAELLKIQNASGVMLVTKEDVAFIKQCWADKVYPRGWSEEDERHGV